MPSSNYSESMYQTDVLIIGGGMAGFFAAVRAVEMGQQVLMVDKGTVGRSGFTPWANTFCVFDETLGDTADSWIEGVTSKGEYLVNLDYFQMLMEDSLARYNQLLEWKIVDTRPEWDRESTLSAYKYLRGHDRRILLPAILKKLGVKLIQRVMVTNLLKKDERVIGAVGFRMENTDAYIFNAKATLLCTGAGGYKAPGYPIHSCTFDGDAMAYHAGARIAGKEFMDFHFTGDISPWNVFEMEDEVFVNRIYPTRGPGKKGEGIGIYPVFEVHDNAPPLTAFMRDEEPPGNETDPRSKGKSLMPRMPSGNIVMGAATGLGVHKSEGVWPADAKCFSGIVGLYAAGDALASMICGASYPTTGMGLSGSAVQGYRAGEAAAAFAAGADLLEPDRDLVARNLDELFSPLRCQRGFSPRWVSQVLLNTMAPYYILLYMHQDRLESALKQIEFMQESFSQRLMAKDNHELRLVFETRNMLLNAEMKLRANLLRTESRGNHFRQDFPARNDQEWLAWVLIDKDEQGKMRLGKEPVPEAWRGNLREEYEERYPRRFPGELEFLQRTTS